MSDVVVEATGPDPDPVSEVEPGQAPAQPHLGWALAGLSTGAGVIHIAMTPIHASSAWQEALGFAAAGWFQLVTAAMVFANRTGKRFYQLVAVANAVFIGVWAYSRTVGLPFGDNAGNAESIGAIDAACVALEVGVILIAVRLAMAPERRSVGRLAPALCAVGALGLATVVITSPDAANHNHTNQLTGIDALNAEVDKTRCDLGFNPESYWNEAEYLGIDTRWGNSPPAVAGSSMSSDGHGHGGSSSSASTTTTEADALEGRGSPGLDHLVSATGLAATSEVEAANLVTALSDASEDDYQAWLWWLRKSGTLDHAHSVTSSTVTAEDGSGHGGHVGPQPWVAMTDQELCDKTEAELALARETAMRYPTAQDAKDAGYRLVTGYLPGIAAHWIKSSLIDGEFDIEEPEMILYDGNELDANVVGLSYYIWHKGDNKPTQGFTGDNDHAHRHLGLCADKVTGTIIGDSTTTEEDCAANGGTKGDGSQGWMSHAWVVEGCESPWGVFSAASPVLDDELPKTSGKDGGHCAGSGVRDRYGMGDGSSGSGSGTEPGTDDSSDTAPDTAGG